jgi:gluconate 5-dehydrogenase
MRMFDMSGRVALITGGSKGLGLSMAEGLAQAGATCVLVSRDAQVCQQAATALEASTGQPAEGCAADITDEAQVAELFAGVMQRHGRLDVLINSAGVNIRHPIEEFPLAEFRAVMDTNLTGTWLCCRAASPILKAAGHGSVINIGSALSAVGLAERTAYCSSKAGVIGLTQTLALEWAATGVRCNAICPGPFLTAMNRPLLEQPERAAAVVGLTALNRWAEMPEIRGAALFLASDASTYVTGTSLFVDGGWTAK